MCDGSRSGIRKIYFCVNTYFTTKISHMSVSSSNSVIRRCARLRTRRMNFAHPPPLHVSGESNISTYESKSPNLSSFYVQLIHINTHLLRSPAAEISSSRESRDSGVSSGSSQDCGDLTPTFDRPSAFPRAQQGKDKVRLKH